MGQGSLQVPAPDPVQHWKGVPAPSQNVLAVQLPVPGPVQQASGRSKARPAATQWLFAQSVWTGDEFATNMPSMEKPELLGIDFSNRRSFYYLCLACLFLMVALGVFWIWRRAERDRAVRDRVNAEEFIVPTNRP